MDRPTPGSVRRARERAQAGLPRQPFSIDRPQVTPDSAPTPVNATAPRQRPMAPLAASSRLPIPNPSLAGDDQATRSMSRPMQPQWPLPGPSISPVTSNKPPRNAVTSERNKQAPPRPPRPSQIPLVVEQPRLQPPRPIYVARPNVPDSPDDINDNFDSSSIEETPSRRTLSSIGSIPDFPPPATSGAPGPPRRSAILGPPPSSRRGASSFYSNASFVSPIPEESPRSRSHGSYASSAAMPEGWTASSPLASPLDSEGYYDDAASESSRESLFEDLGDESRLVQDVPQKKRGAIAGNPLRTAGNTGSSLKIVTTPSQLFRGGTGYMDRSTTSLPLPTSSMPTAANGPAKLGSNALTSDAILKAYTAASLSDLADARAAASYRSSNRFSNLRRPPRLDIDAVREAEARGSLTSLPELIRRATRLASMIDKGKRPASRMDELDGFFGGNEKASRDGDGSISDMLAAFPPPVHTPRNNSRSRGSFIRPDSSWPMVGIQGQQSRARAQSTHLESGAKQKKRRCCGLPTWAVTLLVILILCAIVAAIVIPLEFFVFKNLGNKGNKDESLENCRKSLTCRNGGVNMISAGTCSCICTNGFTGPDCNSGGSPGCTSTDLVATDGSTSISNVTLGKALPRLMADAQRNFSVPLSGNTILGKLNSGGLSCIAQNSLVTFNGQPSGAVLESEAALDSGNRQSIGLLNVQKDDEVVFPPVSPELCHYYYYNDVDTQIICFPHIVYNHTDDDGDDERFHQYKADFDETYELGSDADLCDADLCDIDNG
ncbi:hypothetical protein CDD82_5892 [Ophiocordyceps australis]|uniref:EGF-like domain-containing protein n=1 Tax=Ophiocordyceps australis TaxID=1399860 RepID=A0A2C5YV18_9HYPO|nr:hypothetical protein CDD82_5892 [Ophiocordyceps australis]